jgi:hypothetical protein
MVSASGGENPAWVAVRYSSRQFRQDKAATPFGHALRLRALLGVLT